MYSINIFMINELRKVIRLGHVHKGKQDLCIGAKQFGFRMPRRRPEWEDIKYCLI
jgi:hypothetical protein